VNDVLEALIAFEKQFQREDLGCFDARETVFLRYQHHHM
jgi:hypothetical protein